MKRQYLAISTAIHLVILCLIVSSNNSKSTLGDNRSFNNLQISIYKKIGAQKNEPLKNVLQEKEAVSANALNQLNETNAKTTVRPKQTTINPAINSKERLGKDKARQMRQGKNNTASASSEETSTDRNAKGSKKRAICLKCIKPTYPIRALKKNQKGTVIINVTIDKFGKVSNAKLLKSSGIKSIDKACKLAATNSQFVPSGLEQKLDIEYNLKIKRR